MCLCVVNSVSFSNVVTLSSSRVISANPPAVISGSDFLVSYPVSLSLSFRQRMLNIQALFCVVSRIFYRRLSLVCALVSEGDAPRADRRWRDIAISLRSSNRVHALLLNIPVLSRFLKVGLVGVTGEKILCLGYIGCCKMNEGVFALDLKDCPELQMNFFCVP